MNNLSVQGLSKQYQGFALRDVSFSVPRGYIMGFIGPNGAGKTTTIKAILGMVEPDAGELSIFEQNIWQMDPAEKEKIGVILDAPFVSEDWKVKDVEAALRPFYAQWDHDQYEKYVAQFGLARDKKIKELSRGMKVKLMLATALSHHARVLILDEPTSGLDPVARDELMDILGDFVLNENNSILFSTHITSDLEKIADYVTFIHNGKIVFTGEKDVLLERFVLVKGNPAMLTKKQKQAIIGYREHSVGFEGMLQTDHLSQLPNEVFSERITLDEIIVYMNKEGAPQ